MTGGMYVSLNSGCYSDFITGLLLVDSNHLFTVFEVGGQRDGSVYMEHNCSSGHN
jgi:hypothetical protein